jgi:hypothetical protein
LKIRGKLRLLLKDELHGFLNLFVCHDYLRSLT